MAMNAFSNHPSSSHRQKLFLSTLIGESTFALERPKIRQDLFLQRNISRILGYHEKRLGGGTTSTSTHSRPISAGKTQTTAKDTGSIDSRATRSDSVVNGADTNETNTSVQSTTLSEQASVAAVNMAAALQVPHLPPQKRERSKRRSDRFKEVMEKIYEQIDAELVLDLSNIRKKLNFKTNSINDGERPAKRQKRDTVKCYCHLTIWDNRDGYAATPLTTKSSYCRVTGANNGVHGHFVDLELDTPFVVKAAEIRVPVMTNQNSALEIIDKYFLEFKIIPCRTDSRWPPMPLLGKSDGDHFVHDVKKAGSEELQGAIVARYIHLPTAPDADVPLSVFFLQEGKTYRTKYGLQVQSYWQKAGATPIIRESHSLDLDSFLQAPATIVPPPIEARADPTPSIAVPPRTSPNPPPQSQPEVCYSFPGSISHSEIAQEFRNATLEGYRCPICSPLPRFDKLQHLQFHLSTAHTRYNFLIQKPRKDSLAKGNPQIHIKVEKPVRPTANKEGVDDQMAWIAPVPPFDLGAFVSGDHSWTNGITPKKSQTAGYPLAKDVPHFRKPNRKKLKAISLETRYAHDDPEPVYTSISHRPVSPSEDPRSETDDEIDNEWQISTHMERLDLIASKEAWSPYKRELTKRWDRHRMEEQLEHTSYLSNSLIRFVRNQKDWLKNAEDDELLQCFFEFLARLKERRVIDDNVVVDVNELIFVDAPLHTSPAKKARETQGVVSTADSAKQGSRSGSQAGTQPSMSASTCPLCTTPILPRVKTALFCQDPSCAQPLQKYHKKCVLSGHASLKGNETAARTATVENEAMKLKSWCCQDCVARQKEVLKKREEEREEKRLKEREMVENRARMFLGSIA